MKPLLFYLFLLFITNSKAEKECTVATKDGYYDLNPLTAKKDYEVETEGRTYYINVCRGLVDDVWNPKGVDNPQDVGIKYRGDHGDFSLGQYNTTLRFEHSNPLLVYTGGSPCAVNTAMRVSSAIRFLCDPTVFAAGKPQLVTYLPPDGETPCAYFFEWRTHVACPSNPKTSWSSFIKALVIILLLGVLFYVAAGISYRHFVLGFRGIDALPRISLSGFSDACQNILDYFERTPDRFKDTHNRSWNRRERAHYEALAAEEEQAPLNFDDNHRTSTEEANRDTQDAIRPSEETPAAPHPSSLEGSNKS